MRTITLILITTVVLPAADLDDNTVTVTATRTLNIQPDQALLSVALMTPQDASLDDALGKLGGTGITAANLQSVYQAYGLMAAAGGPYSEWTFIAPVSFTSLNSVLAAMTQAQKSAGLLLGSNALNFYVSGIQASADAQAAQPCPLTALVSDARRQADSMATAAGLRTGAIVSISDGTAIARSPDFTAVIYDPASGAYADLLSPGLTVSQSSCSLTIQFKLLP